MREQLASGVNNNNFYVSIIKFMGVMLCLTLIIELLDIDAWLADVFYRWEGNTWTLKKAWINSILIHKGGKYFSIAVLLIVLLIWCASYLRKELAQWKHYFKYLFFSSLLGTLLVSTIKSITNISCPWDFSRYGGTLEYLSLIDQLWVRNGYHCFPAGHASAGYAWVSVYFVGAHARSIWRWWGLAFAVLLGSIFGLSQQLRGAHFLSHDLWSFGVCWMTSFACYQWLLKPYEYIK